MPTVPNSELPIVLKDRTLLESATMRSNPLHVYDDSDGPLWVAGHEFGPSWVIRAASYETAYEIWIDEQPTIPEDEVYEAYQWEIPGTSDRWGRPETGNLSDYRTVEQANGQHRGIPAFNYQARIDVFNQTGKVFHAGEEMELDLVEGYTYQSNGSGTGIVNEGDYSWLHELTPALLKMNEITLKIAPWDSQYV